VTRDEGGGVELVELADPLATPSSPRRSQ